MAKKCCGNGCDQEQVSCDNLKVALVGNPNAGKTTLFNKLTGARQSTGNWPGVTVERKQGYFKYNGESIRVIDLPGTYSLDYSDASEDEVIARKFCLDCPEHIFVNILDASTLERGLYLTLQLRELGIPTLVYLNMMDVANKRGMTINVEELAHQLKCPIIPISLKGSQTSAQIQKQLIKTSQANKNPEDFTLQYDENVEIALAELQRKHECNRPQALKILQENQSELTAKMIAEIETKTGEELDFLLAEVRFEKATELAKKVVTEQGKVSRTRSDKIDKYVLGNWLGVPIFLAMMYLLFTFSINLGGAFIDVFDLTAQAFFVDGLGSLMANIGLPQWLITIVANGVGGGVQVVATFIPIIGALFLFLTVLEESGYMSRAAFVMDHFMRKLGISGKAFVPLIVGFGCNVPGIMATRTLDDARERIITVMMSPFMSCGARLAVYALFAAAFFPVGGQNIVFLLYLIGILFAIMTGFILRKTLLKGEAEDFFMELPNYQIPSVNSVLINSWGKLKGFIFGAGKIIIIVVTCINVANSLGTDLTFGNENSEKSVLSATARTVTPIFKPMGIEEDNWPATVGIITGLLAKEVVVGTLDALYSQIDKPQMADANKVVDGNTDENKEDAFDLSSSLKAAFLTVPENLTGVADSLLDPLGLSIVDDISDSEKAAATQEVDISTFGAMHKRFDGKIGAFAYLLFILLYFPCVAATGAMIRETSKGWGMLGIAWTTGLAYASAVIFYQLATISQHPAQSIIWVVCLLAILTATIYAFKVVGNKEPDNHKPLNSSVS
ncbi:Fe(2+) transporter permease subunit FeoB [Cocleimonas flava]|uniref:Ferrous iron transport protein B n=1 Tax=Cocleimonas flava TaxID=634765 RepID=A0A4R1EYR5_9GAMM|nr:Fe(2+) transporter permease subunit FeoB [Cocleimonas flava]TCJ85059.1 ferrous iron transport protein B [Cocleimonas flava]